MINIEDKTKCCGCFACKNICPKDAISMIEDEYGFKYPKINLEKCINCGLCVKSCPIINKKDIQNFPKAYAIKNKDLNIRLNSSSGGVFSLIAKKIIDNDGVVFGATFDENFAVNHIMCSSKEELEKLRTSKYVQSNINETYTQAKNELKKGKKVLFTGTPCQISGLISFLGKKYENLYTQDIICHGVPSYRVWKKYLEYRKKIDNEIPIKINFRKKDDGFSSYFMYFKYKNSEYMKKNTEDLYMKAFLQNLSLRDSCYNCNFKGKNRISDITLADLWGIDKIAPEMNDKKGTSLVFINSEKGKKLLENIKDYIIYKEVDIDEAVKYNKAAIKSVPKNKKRKSFFKNLDKMGFDKLVKKYTYSDNVIEKNIRRIKRKIINLIFK